MSAPLVGILIAAAIAAVPWIVTVAGRMRRSARVATEIGERVILANETRELGQRILASRRESSLGAGRRRLR
jgi:hypothetical protein